MYGTFSCEGDVLLPVSQDDNPATIQRGGLRNWPFDIYSFHIKGNGRFCLKFD
jgi:hypothetical protein